MNRNIIKNMTAFACGLGLLAFAGCSNSLSDSQNDTEYGTITINSGDRALDYSGYTSATVEVYGSNMTSVKKSNVTLSNGTASAVTVDGIPVGKNRVVKVTSNGLSMYGVIDQVYSGTNAANNVTVNWDSTPLGGYLYTLIQNNTDITNYDSEKTAYQTSVNALGVHGSCVDFSESTPAKKAGTVKVTASNLSGYSYKVTDPASEEVTVSSASDTKSLTCATGNYKVAVYKDGTEAKSENLIVGKNAATTVTIKYGEGVDFSGKTIVFVKSSSAPDIWAWEDGGVALSTKLGGDWNVSSTYTKMTAATTDYMSDPSGWYMMDYTSVATAGSSKTIKFILNWGSTVTGAAGTFWYDGSSASTTNPSPAVAGIEISVENPVVPVAPTVTISPADGSEIGLSGSVTISVNAGNTTLTSGTATINGTSKTLSEGTNTFKLADLGITTAGKSFTVSATVKNSEGTGSCGPYTYTTKEAAAVADTFTWDNALMYFVIQDRFYDGDSSNNNSYGRMTTDDLGKKIGTFHGGDIKGLTEKLDYINGLGINAIWITAPYEQAHGWCGGGDNGDFAHYGYHGYYTLDYTEMDKNMGTIEEFRTFVTECHKRGIRVVMDVVMNHTGYLTLQDCQDYSLNIFTGTYSGGKSTDMGFKIGVDGATYHKHHDLIDYSGHADEWAKWWGNTWVRSGVPGYTDGGSDDLTKCLNSLPDVKTESTTAQTVAPILQTKWAKETSGYDNWIVPAAKSLRNTSSTNAPVEWIEKWLAAWVEEFGIDGFRCDTAKHVDHYRWGELSTLCKTALKTWRASSRADEYAKDWDEDFYMTGEAFGWKNNGGGDWFSNGFVSMIDFTVASGDGMQTYSPTLPDWSSRVGANGLLYISSHDTGLGRWSDQKSLGTKFVLMPGEVQIFYGDETSRSFGETGSDKNQGTRSDFNWDAATGDCAKHWGKVGTFRKFNPAVGAGTMSGDTRTYGDNKVVISTSSTTVSVPYSDGTTVYNWYDGTSATVSGGKVSFSSSSASDDAPVLCSDRDPADYGVTF